MELPLGHEAVHQTDEAGIVGGLEQVSKLVDDDVLEALGWLLGQLGIEADGARPVRYLALPSDGPAWLLG